MPIRIQSDLPTKTVLEQENTFVTDKKRAVPQDTHPSQILILSLMPLREDAELQLLRALSDTLSQMDCTFLTTSFHEATHTSKSYISNFYVFSGRVKHHHFDGLIITGAPVENLPCEEVSYREELCGIMEWLRTHVVSTPYICWGAQVEPYYHYGIQKYPRKGKFSGVYCHRALHHSMPLIRNMDDYMDYLHLYWIEMWCGDIIKCPELTILAEPGEAGTLLLADETGWQVFVQGHPEYDRMTLDSKYRRDKAQGMEPKIPFHHYENDNPSSRPLLSWQNMANTLYAN